MAAAVTASDGALRDVTNRILLQEQVDTNVLNTKQCNT